MSEAVIPERVADWTIDPDTGRSNSSAEFLELVDAVEQLLRQSGGCLDPAWTASTATLVMAQLAHVHRLSPRTEALACWLCWLTERCEEAAASPAVMIANGVSVCWAHAPLVQGGEGAAALRLLQERRGGKPL